MHPAFSVIFLTTLIGMGQGLFLAIYTQQVYSDLNVVQKIDTSTDMFFGIASGVSLLLLIFGLIASMFHLGHPERAWRSAAMWRTSWLSREVIVLPTVMVLIFSYGLIYIMHWNVAVMTIGAVEINLSLIIGAITSLAVFSLFKVSVLLLGIAMESMYLGLLAERWYFFAEGYHPQNIYYQSIA